MLSVPQSAVRSVSTVLTSERPDCEIDLRLPHGAEKVMMQFAKLRPALSLIFFTES